MPTSKNKTFALEDVTPGKILDWAVATAIGLNVVASPDKDSPAMQNPLLASLWENTYLDENNQRQPVPHFSASWLHSGPLFEKFEVGFSKVKEGWTATCEKEHVTDPSMIQAGLRVIVATKLGRKVKIPVSLLN